jgi:hypothetical protein
MNNHLVALTNAVNNTYGPLNRVEKGIKGVSDEAANSQSKLGGFMKELLPIASVGAGIAVLKQLGSGIIDVTAEFQKYQAVLANTLGSQDEANRVMKDLQTFAAMTPFSLSELTGAYVKLTNYGLQPTMEQMRQYGDLASSVGKGFDQLAEAAADAVTGQFERLKEFGINAAKEGDKITFTFKEQATVVKNNATDIQQYLASLGDMEGVRGGMEAISKTIGGQISNLGDTIDKMFNKIGQANSGLISDTIGGVSTIIEHYEEIIKVIGILVATYGAYKAAIMVTAAVQKASAIAGNVQAWFELARGIKTAKDAQVAFSLVTKASPIGLITAAISGLVLAFALLHKSTKSATEAQEEFNKLKDQQKDVDSTSKMIDRYNELSTKQGKTNEEQAEYNRLIDELSKKIPEATGKIDEHGRVLGLNSDKLKAYNEQQKGAIKLVAEQQLKEAEDALIKLNKKLASAQGKTSETKEVYIASGMGPGTTTVVERTGKERAKAAAEVLKISEEIEKYKETVNGLKQTLGLEIPMTVTVTDNMATGNNKAAIKQTVGDQIDAINAEITKQQENLKSLRNVKTSTATTQEIEDAEKNIKSLQDKLATLTGVTKKESDKAAKEAAVGSVKYLEEQVKKLQDKQWSFIDPKKEVENANKIKELLDEIERRKLEIAMMSKDDQFTIIPKMNEKAVKQISTTDEQKLVSDAYAKLGYSQAQKLTDEQKKQVNNEIEKARVSKESSKFNLAAVKQITTEQANHLKQDQERIDKSINFKESVKDGLEGFSEIAITSADIGNALFDAVSFLNEGLGESGKDMANLVGQAGTFAGALASGDWVGAIMSGLGLIGQVLDLNNEKQKRIIEKQIEYNKLLQEQVDLLVKAGILSPTEGATESLRQLREEIDLYKQTINTGVSIQITGYDSQMNEVKRNVGYRLTEIMDAVYGKDWGAEELFRAMDDVNGLMTQFMSLTTGTIWDSETEFWSTNFDSTTTTEFIKGLTEIEGKINSIQEQFIGFTNSDLVGSVVDGIAEGLKLGKDDLGDFAGSFEELMKKAARNAILSSFNNQYFTKIQRQMTSAMSLDSDEGFKVSEKELLAMQDTYRQAVEYGNKMAENWSNVFGDFTDAAASANSMKGSIQGITEKTAGVLEGSISSIQYNVIGMRDLMNKQIMHLAEIAHNTSYNFHLESMPDVVRLLKDVNKLLDDIKTKPQTGGGDYGIM